MEGGVEANMFIALDSVAALLLCSKSPGNRTFPVYSQEEIIYSTEENQQSNLLPLQYIHKERPKCQSRYRIRLD